MPQDIQLVFETPNFFLGLFILILELIIPIGIGLILHRKHYGNKIIISVMLIIALLLFGIMQNKVLTKIISHNVSIGSYLKDVENFHIDGWVEQDAKIEIAVGDMNKIIIVGEYIGDISGSEKVYITVNQGEKLEFDIKDNSFILDIPVDGKQDITLDIKTNFTIDSGNDVRNLSFVIRDIKLQ